MYDSALLYLEPVLENKRNRFLQIRIANYLRIIYDSLGNREKSNECMSYLALHNETGPENSVLVSQLSEMYKTYISRKQEKEATIKREAAVKKTIEIVAPIAAALALVIIVAAKWRSKKLLKEQREESDRVLGEKEQQQRMQQAALSGRLKRSNEELRELKDQMELQNIDKTKTDAAQAATFAEEPICRLILERVKEGQFLSQMDCKTYKDYALDKDQLIALREAVDCHYNQFTKRICAAHPELTRGDLDYCCLYLLGLTDADVAALMQRAYNTVNERNSKLRRIFNSKKAIGITLQTIAKG